MSPPSKTILLLIDIQQGLTSPNTSHHWGPLRSNPLFEENTTRLITSYRDLITSSSSSSSSSRQAQNHEIIHIQHSSTSPTSPLHATNAPSTFAFADFATPNGEEKVFIKSVNSAFIGTGLEAYLRGYFTPSPSSSSTREDDARDAKGIERGANGSESVIQGNKLYILGLTTDHCVSTTVRMAANLGVIHGDGDRDGDEEGEVVFIGDATACWEKWPEVGDGENEAGDERLSAEIVHRVHVQSLKEFATVKTTREVLDEWESWK